MNKLGEIFNQYAAAFSEATEETGFNKDRKYKARMGGYSMSIEKIKAIMEKIMELRNQFEVEAMKTGDPTPQATADALEDIRLDLQALGTEELNK